MAIYVFFITSSILTIFFGNTGVSALRQLNQKNTLLSDNMTDLQSKKMELTRMLRALRTDPESLEIEARKMGLYEENTKVLLFQNMDNFQPLPEAGRVLFVDSSFNISMEFFRVLSALFALSTFIAGLIAWKIRGAS